MIVTETPSNLTGRFINNSKRHRIVRNLVIFVLLASAIILRVIQFKYINADIHNYFVPWFEYLINNGGIFGIKDLVYAYSPPYLYLLTIAIPLTHFFTPIEVIKIVSVCFDFVSAFYIYKIIELKHPLGALKWIGFFCICFAPTVFINSAYWAQCDGIYSSFLMMSIYYIFRKKITHAMIFFATAVVFKVQALILTPLIVILFFRRMISWRSLLIMPVTYLFWLLPAFMTGFPIFGTLTMSIDQSTSYHQLTMHAPNLYVFISNRYYDVFVPLGWLLGLGSCCILTLKVIRSKVELTNERILLFIVMITTIIPFVLPKMHERYFYPAALIAIALPFYLPKFRLVPFVLQATSLLSYTVFLQGREILPLSIPSIINGVLVIVLIHFFTQSFHPNRPFIES